MQLSVAVRIASMEERPALMRARLRGGSIGLCTIFQSERMSSCPTGQGTHLAKVIRQRLYDGFASEQ